MQSNEEAYPFYPDLFHLKDIIPTTNFIFYNSVTSFYVGKTISELQARTFAPSFIKHCYS